MPDATTGGSGIPAGMADDTAGRGIRVLLVDDQPLIRLGFRMVLEGEPDLEVVGEAEDGDAAVALASELAPDVVIMDVRMPGTDGIAATARIVERTPGVRVLIVTTFDLDEYAFAGLRAGASGFLLKNAPPPELVRAIRTVAAGDAIVEPRITRRLLDLFGDRLPGPDDGAASPRPSVTPTDAANSALRRTGPLRDPRSDPRLASLTEREAEVFTAIARGMSNAEISSAFYVSESTVKTHVGRILMKLGLRDRIHAVVLGYETGVVTPGAPGDSGALP
jgi:DNA-binding NarL/FixJ family response regulator